MKQAHSLGADCTRANLLRKVDFRVGSPWGKTALLTGWGVDDLLFKSAYIEYYFTSSYLGFEHRFSPRLDVKALAEDVRSWRIYQVALGYFAESAPGRKCRFHPQAQLGPAILKRLFKCQRISHLRRDAEWDFHLLFAAVSAACSTTIRRRHAAVSHPLFGGRATGNFLQFSGRSESDV